MLALTVSEDDVKIFMQKLLKEDIFDAFEVRTVIISTYTRIEISEEKQKQEDESFKRQICLWEKIRPLVFSVLKGQKRPDYMKVVFSFDTGRIGEITENAAALFLNMTFDGTKVFITTGCAQKVFSLDKSPEMLWDEHIEGFLEKAGILFTAD